MYTAFITKIFCFLFSRHESQKNSVSFGYIQGVAKLHIQRFNTDSRREFIAVLIDLSSLKIHTRLSLQKYINFLSLWTVFTICIRFGTIVLNNNTIRLFLTIFVVISEVCFF